MQEHHYAFDVDASPEDIWEVFWYHGPDKPMTPGVTIEILHPGDDVGNGLVRHCHFPVPKFLGTRGIGQSWEWVTEVKPYESWKYDAIGKPLWSKAEGFITLTPAGDGKTRVDLWSATGRSTRGWSGSGSRSGCTRSCRATTTRSSTRSPAAWRSTASGRRHSPRNLSALDV